MSVPIQEFWRLAIESRLLNMDECRQLSNEFAHVKGADNASGRTLAEWLISLNVLSRYQTTVLLAGRPGPFYYGEYKIYDRIESGPRAGAFKAVHAATSHPVVLEFVSGPAAQDHEQWVKLARRVTQYVELKHPHVARTFELVDLTAFKFLVLEDTPGQTFDQVLASASRLPAHEAARVVRSAALGLAAMHDKGLIHGDIRPARIRIEQGGFVRIAHEPLRDTGPINWQDPSHRKDLDYRADYLAPELANPGKGPDVLTDIYALGATFYQLVAGHTPFQGGDAVNKLARHASEAIPPLDQIAGAPASVGQMVAYMMAKNPSVRYQQAAAVAEQAAGMADPRHLNIQPPAPPSTLAAFEHHLAEKQSRLASEAARGPSSFPAVAPTNGGLPQSTGQPVVASAAMAGSASAAASGTAATAGTGSAGAGSSGGASRPVAISTGAASGSVSPRKEIEPDKGFLESLPENKPALIGGAVVLTLAIVGGLVWLTSSSKPKQNPGYASTETGGPTVRNTDGGPTQRPPTGGSANLPEDVATPAPPPPGADDNVSLWASPTAGEAIAFNYVPPTAQIYIVARPADLLATDEGGDMLKALGPDFEVIRSSWESAAQVKLNEIDRMIISLHDNDDKVPRVSTVVYLKQPVDLRGRWGLPAMEEGEEPADEVLNLRGWARWIPPNGGGQVFVMGAQEDVAESQKNGGRPPLMSPDMERIVRLTDADRQLTILFPPHYFFSGGQALFVGKYEKLLDPLSWFFGDGIKVCLVSMHLDETNFYAEMRPYARLEQDAVSLNTDFKQRIESVPQRLEPYILSINPPDYWRRLWFKYPQMLAFMGKYTRYGIEDGKAIFNVALPKAAATYIMVASEMTISSEPGMIAASAGPTKAAPPKTLAELLKRKTSFSFNQTSLEFSMRDLADSIRDEFPGLPFDFQIRIIGPDLQLDGITRNQQVRDFKQTDQTVEDILTALVVKAQGLADKPPSDPEQKLLWVVGPNPDAPDKQIVLITTRAQSKVKGYTLPPPFRES